MAVLYTAVAVALMATSGALESGFGAFEDEPAHFVTGLMVRDYLADALGQHPMRYAEQYYLHYPKVAIGHWPPGFYALEGVWMLAFGVSTLSVLLLMCALSAATATVVFAAVRADAGDGLAALAGLFLLLAPLVQKYGHMAMTEVPQALLVTSASLCFGRFLEVGRARWVLAFALLAVASILTKGSGLFLALVPPIAILLTGRWDVLRRPALWLSALLVAVLCAPWYLLTLDVSRSTWGAGRSPSVAYTLEAVPYYAKALFQLGGAVLGSVAVFGLVERQRQGERAGRWGALAAWLPSLLLCAVVVPTGIDERHLVLAAPVWMCGWAAGAAWLVGRWPGSFWGGVPVLPLLLVGSFFVEAFERPLKQFRGYREPARELLADESLAESVFLVASDSFGEGLFVAAVAMNDRQRPGHIVLRASKVLAKSDWLGHDYSLTYQTPEELSAFLADVPVGVVVLDEATERHHWYPHHDLLDQMLEAYPDVWRKVGAYDVVRDGVAYPGALRVYRQAGHEDRPVRALDVQRILGREVPGF